MKLLKYSPILILIVFLINCQKNSPTEPGNIDSFYWDISVEQIIGPDGGTLTDPNTGAKLEVPAGALENETTLVMGPAYNLPIDNSVHIPTSEYYFGPDNVDFLKPVTITIPYNEAELPSGVKEENLQMHQYHMDKSELRTTNSTVNIDDNTISTNTKSFSFYVPGGDIAPTNVVLHNGKNITDSNIMLEWESEWDYDFLSFKIYYNSQPNITTSNIGLAEITNQSLKLFNMVTVNPQTTYYFKIFKYDQNGLVTESNEISVTTGQQSVVVTFNDTNLENVIRENLNKPTGDITNVELATITTLNGNDSKISDLSVLKYCTNLEWLYLSNNLISDLSALSGLNNLEGLYLERNNINDISPLITLENLETLQVNYNQISDIRVLPNLVNLIYLYLNYNNIENISFIRNMPLLSSLYFSYNNVSTINGLRNLPNLESLGMQYNNIESISRVADFTNLRYFYAEGNNISNVNALANHAKLYTVDLDYNQIVNISPLANNHPDLRYLYLQHNNITEIPSMANLTSLRNFYVSYNTITDISGLSGLTSVEYLYMYYNNIVNISSLETVTNIRGLGISYNNIEDLEPLVNNAGLASGDYVYGYGNNYNEMSINTHIPALEARGVNVYR